MRTYYEILEVEPNATNADIKRAYRRLAMLHHPDVGGNKEEFQELGEAYNVLGNNEKREQYDRGEGEAFQEPQQEDFYRNTEDIFTEFVRQNLGAFDTKTSVDQFVSAYPRYFFRRDDDAWSELYPDTDIPYNVEEVKILKLDEALGLLQVNLKYQLERYARPVDNAYAEKASHEGYFRIIDIDEAVDLRLLNTAELFRLAFGLKKEGWLHEDDYEKTIELIDEVDILKSERENVEQTDVQKERRLEIHIERAEALLKNVLTSEHREKQKKTDQSWIREHHRAHFKREMGVKNNKEVAQIHEETRRLAEVTGRSYIKKNKQPWKEDDKRKQWRKENGGIKLR